MIKGIHGTSKHIVISGGNTAGTYVNSYSGAQGVGNVRYNTSGQNFEVYDGNNWTPIMSSTAGVGLSPDAESLLDWASQKRKEEMEYEALAEKNQAVKLALDNVKKAQEQLTITSKLAREYEQTHS